MKERILIISFLVIVVVLLGGGYYAYHIQREAVLENHFNQLSAIKNLKVKQISGWRKERIGDAKAILKNPLILNELKQYLKSRNPDTRTALLLWFETLKESYDYSEIILTDGKFNKILSSNVISEINLSEDHLRKYQNLDTDESIIISEIHIGKSGEPHYTIIINFRTGEDIYCRLLIVVDPSKFLYPLIQTWPMPSKTAESIIVKQKDDSLIFLNELRHRSNTALKLKMPITKEKLPAAVAVKGHTGMYRGYDYRGHKVLADVGPVPETDWYIIAKIDEEEIFQELNRALGSSIIIVLLMILVTYLLFIYLWRSTKISAMKNELTLQEEKVRLSNLYATLSQINQAIVREPTKAELILKVTRFPVEYGNFSACGIAIHDNELQELKVESFSGELDYFHQVLTDTSTFEHPDPCSKAFETNRTTIVNNTSELVEEWANIASANRIKSCAASPIIVNGVKIGAFALYSEMQDYFGEREVKLLEETTSDISFAFEVYEKNRVRSEMEQLIIEHERKLSTLFANLPGIAYRCKPDREWTMEFMSDYTKDLTGYEADEIINNNKISYGELILEEDRENVWRKVNESVISRSTYTISYRIVPKNKTEIKWVWERGVPVYDEEDNLIALEGFISDVTEAKQAEKKLIEAKETAERADQIKSDFLAQMSHEIRTPINVILSFNSLIKDAVYEKLDQDLKEAFVSIENASKRLIRTIDSILNMAQITRGAFTMDVEKLDLDKHILAKTVEEFSFIADHKGIKLYIEKQCDSSEVLADRYSVMQLFTNLVDNAIKYTDEGEVKISIDCTETNVVVKISDTGIGIADTYLPNLFTPFSQEEMGYSRKFEGSGLGLALVKSYCDMNNANISVESKKGTGTTFTVTFTRN